MTNYIKQANEANEYKKHHTLISYCLITLHESPFKIMFKRKTNKFKMQYAHQAANLLRKNLFESAVNIHLIRQMGTPICLIGHYHLMLKEPHA